MKQQLSYQMGDGHNVTGEMPVSYDNLVFEDIEENIVFKNSNISYHYDMVMSTLGDSYKGVNKYTYGNILQAIKTIVDSKKNHLRGSAKAEATAYLHAEMLFSSVTIQKILLLFGIKMSMGKILDDATLAFEQRPEPAWMQKFLGGVN
jgi:hypothetical protein